MEFYQQLEDLLKQNPKYLDADGKLIKQKVIDAAERIDSQLIELLISKPNVKKEFFTLIKDVYVFNINHFVRFVKDKNFLADSYTEFANKIGLSVNGELLKKRDEVCLVFPYKDCILEGGQTKEECGRKEIFFNKILAKDEINKLLSPKAFVNFEKWDEEAVKNEKPKPVYDISEDDNLLIKGNNLLALHCLKHKYAGKVKLIYIDPPYNTGNDSFKYNDNFNHSSWLTFMKNRLEIARELLSEDGSIYVSIDLKEHHYLKLLMDDVFGRKNFINDVVWNTSPLNVAGFKGKASNWVYSISNLLYYCKYAANRKFHKMYNSRSEKFIEDNYRQEDENGRFRITRRGNKVYMKDDKGDPITNIWNDILSFNYVAVASSEGRNFSYGQKPEKLIQRIILSSTDPGDIVLDFFAGTGTTGAVAHKLNRKWIMIEQMDAQIDIVQQRLHEVIEGEQGGISKALNWKGSGSFIYFELATYNQKFIDEIEQAKDSTTLLAIWDDMKNCGFLLHNLEVKKFDKNIDEFGKKELSKQKEILLQTLNMNMLYVPLSDIEDMKYNISDDDIELNKVFYGSEYISTEG